MIRLEIPCIPTKVGTRKIIKARNREKEANLITLYAWVSII